VAARTGLPDSFESQWFKLGGGSGHEVAFTPDWHSLVRPSLNNGNRFTVFTQQVKLRSEPWAFVEMKSPSRKSANGKRFQPQLTAVAQKPRLVIEQATFPYSFRSSELSQPI